MYILSESTACEDNGRPLLQIYSHCIAQSVIRKGRFKCVSRLGPYLINFHLFRFYHQNYYTNKKLYLNIPFIYMYI